MKLDRRQLKKLIIKEMSVPPRSTNSGLNRDLAVEMLKSVINDMQNVPEKNLNKYIQYLINFQIPNIIRTLED